MFLFVVPSEREFASVAEVLWAAASPLRLMILTYLNRTPMSVQQLADELAKSQPLVPHRDHVDYLHDGHRHAAHDEH